MLLANNRLGCRIGEYLASRGDLIGLVVHPEERRAYGEELEALDAPTWVWPGGREAIAELRPECLLSVLFGYILKADWLSLPTWRAVNLHPAMLPYNRGSAPNVWPIVDGTPAGTTLHCMDEGIDTGALLAQREVPVAPDDTAESLYHRLEDESYRMFEDVWPTIADVEPWRQVGEGTYHRMSDLESLDLRGDEALRVLDRIRARTFPPYGAEFERAGRRWRATVTIVPAD